MSDGDDDGLPPEQTRPLTSAKRGGSGASQRRRAPSYLVTAAAAVPPLIRIGSFLRLSGLQTLPDNQIKALKPRTNTMKRHFCASSPDFFTRKYSLSWLPLEKLHNGSANPTSAPRPRATDLNPPRVRQRPGRTISPSLSALLRSLTALSHTSVHASGCS